MDAFMRFPHVRLAAGKVTVYDAPGNNPMDLFDRLRQFLLPAEQNTVCTENPIRVDDVMESPKLAE